MAVMRWRVKRMAGRLALYASVLVLVSPAAFVFLWMLSLSLKNEVDNMAFPPVFIPHPPTLANFVKVFAENDFLSYTINSVIVSFSATLLALAIGVPAGYGIARMRAMRAATLILVARLTPGLSYFIPLFLLFQWVGMIGTLTPIVITHLVISSLCKSEAQLQLNSNHVRTAK
ncbi:MAG: carbohydrate ABC transporter permease [Acetobacteraceae bacterium]|nr:carbohydrate ABC transporter permease [Acetobacteraceae bacterium]